MKSPDGWSIADSIELGLASWFGHSLGESGHEGEVGFDRNHTISGGNRGVEPR